MADGQSSLKSTTTSAANSGVDVHVESQSATPAWKIALHWWILGALLLGALVGIGLNVFWTQATWAALGIQDSKTFLSHASASGGVKTAAASVNDPGFFAYVVRFVIEFGQFVGDLFIRLLRLVAIPVVLFSLLAAVGGVGNPRELGKLGVRTIGIFALTAVLAVTIGTALALLINPGRFVTEEARQKLMTLQAGSAEVRQQAAADFAQSNTIWSQILDIFPSNPMAALATGNVLQVVIAAVLFGIGLTLIDQEKRKLALTWCEALADAGLRLVGLILKGAPVAVFFMTASIAATMGWSVLAGAAAFMLTVLLGMGLILVAVYPAVMRLLTPAKGPNGEPRLTIRQVWKALVPAQVLAFSSSSSTATLPATMACCDAMGLPKRVTRFVCPLGTTINMDGTAMYQVLCVTFLAQIFGVPLDAGDYVTIALMAILVAVGSPGLPGASIVLMVFILEAVNVPASGIAIIIAVDRLLDMARTVVNVTGDAAASVVVAQGEREPVAADDGNPAAGQPVAG